MDFGFLITEFESSSSKQKIWAFLIKDDLALYQHHIWMIFLCYMLFDWI